MRLGSSSAARRPSAAHAVAADLQSEVHNGAAATVVRPPQQLDDGSRKLLERALALALRLQSCDKAAATDVASSIAELSAVVAQLGASAVQGAAESDLWRLSCCAWTAAARLHSRDVGPSGSDLEALGWRIYGLLRDGAVAEQEPQVAATRAAVHHRLGRQWLALAQHPRAEAHLGAARECMAMLEGMQVELPDDGFTGADAVGGGAAAAAAGANGLLALQAAVLQDSLLLALRMGQRALVTNLASHLMAKLASLPAEASAFKQQAAVAVLGQLLQEAMTAMTSSADTSGPPDAINLAYEIGASLMPLQQQQADGDAPSSSEAAAAELCDVFARVVKLLSSWRLKCGMSEEALQLLQAHQALQTQQAPEAALLLMLRAHATLQQWPAAADTIQQLAGMEPVARGIASMKASLLALLRCGDEQLQQQQAAPAAGLLHCLRQALSCCMALLQQHAGAGAGAASAEVLVEMLEALATSALCRRCSHDGADGSGGGGAQALLLEVISRQDAMRQLSSSAPLKRRCHALLYGCGLAAHSAGHYASAREWLSAALLVASEEDHGRTARAIAACCHLELGQQQRAREYIALAVQREPGAMANCLLQLRGHLRSGDIAAALHDLDRLVLADDFLPAACLPAVYQEAMRAEALSVAYRAMCLLQKHHQQATSKAGGSGGSRSVSACYVTIGLLQALAAMAVLQPHATEAKVAQQQHVVATTVEQAAAALRWAQQQIQACGAAAFFGLGGDDDGGCSAAQWLADAAVAVGVDAAGLGNLEACLSCMQCAATLGAHADGSSAADGISELAALSSDVVHLAAAASAKMVASCGTRATGAIEARAALEAWAQQTLLLHQAPLADGSEQQQHEEPSSMKLLLACAICLGHDAGSGVVQQQLLQHIAAAMIPSAVANNGSPDAALGLLQLGELCLSSCNEFLAATEQPGAVSIGSTARLALEAAFDAAINSCHAAAEQQQAGQAAASWSTAAAAVRRLLQQCGDDGEAQLGVFARALRALQPDHPHTAAGDCSHPRPVAEAASGLVDWLCKSCWNQGVRLLAGAVPPAVVATPAAAKLTGLVAQHKAGAAAPHAAAVMNLASNQQLGLAFLSMAIQLAHCCAAPGGTAAIDHDDDLLQPPLPAAGAGRLRGGGEALRARRQELLQELLPGCDADAAAHAAAAVCGAAMDKVAARRCSPKDDEQAPAGAAVAAKGSSQLQPSEMECDEKRADEVVPPAVEEGGQLDEDAGERKHQQQLQLGASPAVAASAGASQ